MKFIEATRGQFWNAQFASAVAAHTHAQLTTFAYASGELQTAVVFVVYGLCEMNHF